MLCEQTWTQLSGKRLLTLLSNSYLMTDEAFAYILPAALTTSLANPNELGSIIDRVVITYVPSGHYPNRSMRPLTSDQRAVFCDWFEWAIEGVQQDWQEYAEETGDVNCLVEPEENLVELRAYLSRWRSKT